jgi:hypothetical protein
MAVASGESSSFPPSVSLYAISWGPSRDNKDLVARVNYRSVVAAPAAVQVILKELDPQDRRRLPVWSVPRVGSVATWRETGGVGVVVAGRAWRLFSDAAQVIDAQAGARHEWSALGEPQRGCKELGDVLATRVQPGFKSRVFEQGSLCFEIQRGNPKEMPAGPSTQREQVLIAVYDRPLPEDIRQLGTAPPAAIASIANFGRFPPDAGTWLIGVGGAHEGWIALEHKLPDKSAVFSGAPWSTSALLRLGCAVYRPQPSSSQGSGSDSDEPPCPAGPAR